MIYNNTKNASSRLIKSANVSIQGGCPGRFAPRLSASAMTYQPATCRKSTASRGAAGVNVKRSWPALPALSPTAMRCAATPRRWRSRAKAPARKISSDGATAAPRVEVDAASVPICSAT